MAEILEVVIDSSGAVRGGRTVQRELGQISGEAVKTDKAMRGVGGSMADIAKIAAAGLGFAGIVAGMRQAISVASQFQSALSNLSAITGATGKDLEYLSAQALEISKNSHTAARDVVEAFKLIGSAQPELLKSGAALSEVTKNAVLLAEASKLDLATAAKSLATAMNQFSASADQAAQFTNVLAAASQLGSAEVDALSVATVKAGTAAAGAGISFEDFAATVGKLAKTGAQAENIGTSLRNIFIRLQTGADETNPAIVGLYTALDNLAARSLSAEEKLKLFGLENITVAENLIKLRNEIRFLAGDITGTNTAVEQAATNYDNLEGAYQRASIAAENFYINVIGKSETLTTILNGAANAVNYFTSLFSAQTPAAAVAEAGGPVAALQKIVDLEDELSRISQRGYDLGLSPDNNLAFAESLKPVQEQLELLKKGLQEVFGAAGGGSASPGSSAGSGGSSGGGRIESTAKQFDALRQSLDAAYAAEVEYAEGQKLINANAEKGTELYERLYKLLNDRYNVALLEAAEAAKTTKGQVYSQVAALDDQYNALQKGERAFRVLTTAQKLQRQDLTLSPAVAMEYAEALVTAEEKLENFRKSQETAAEASKKAREEMAQQAKEDERLLQQPFLNAIDGIQGAFKDAFREILDGGVDSFKSFGDTILNIMKDVIAEIAALMVFRPVVGGVLNSLGGGGIAQQLGIPAGGSIFGSGSSIGNTGAAGGTSGGFAAANQGQYGYTFGGVAGGALAGAGIGYGVGSVGGLNTTGSTIGGTVGGAVGSFWGPVGTVIGSVAGSIIGGVIGDAFTKQRDQQFSIATAARGSQGALDATGHYLFEGNRTRRSPFGTIGLLNADTSGTKGKTDEAILDTVLAFDEAIAQVLDIRQQQTIARFLQAARDGTTQHATSLGEGDIGAALKDRLLQMAEGLIGRPLQGLADQLAQINNKDLSKIQSEGARLIDLIALFADGFERGIRAITGGLNPLEQQIFNLEEEAAAAAKAISDNITKIREAVDLLRPNVPNQDDFTKVVERTVTETHGQGDSRYTVTRVIREIVPDVEAFRKAMEEARPGIEEFNKEFRQSEKAIKQMVLAAIGLGKDADVKELQGAALALKELMIRMREMKPVLIEAGFTAEEAAAKIEKAIKKAKRELRNDFNDSIDQQILQITNPFQAAMNDLIELQKQRIQDAKRLGGDLQDVYRLNHLERLELEKQYANQSLSQLQDFITELKTGDLSILSQRGQARVAGQNFNRIARQALNGDLDVGEFSSAARAYLEEQRALYGSGAGYRDAYNNVLRIAEKLGVNLNEDANDRRTNELRNDIKNQAELDRQNRNENFARQIDEMRKTQKTNDAILEAIVDLSRRLSEQGQEDVA